MLFSCNIATNESSFNMLFFSSYSFMKSYEKVVSCSPKGGITAVDGQVFNQMLSETSAHIAHVGNIRQQMLSLGRQSLQLKRDYVALKMFEAVVTLCVDNDAQRGSTRNADLARAAASEVDALWLRIYPNERRRSLERWVKDRYTVIYFDALFEDEAIWESWASEDAIPRIYTTGAGPRP